MLFKLNSVNKFIVILLFTITTNSLPVKADPLTLNKAETHTVTEQIEFLFLDPLGIISAIKDLKTVRLTFSNFMDGPITITPIVNFVESGNTQTIADNRTITVTFNDLPSEVFSVGFLVKPLSRIATFTLLITTESIITSLPSSTPNPTDDSGISLISPGIEFLFLVELAKNIDKFTDQNPRCQSDTCGVNPENVNNLEIMAVVEELQQIINAEEEDEEFRVIRSKTLGQSPEFLHHNLSDISSNPVLNYKRTLKNQTNKPITFLTGIFPATKISNTVSRLSNQKTDQIKYQGTNSNIGVSLENTVRIKPVKSAENGGVFSPKSGTCISGLSASISEGKITADNNSCKPKKVTRGNISYPLVTSNKIFSDFALDSNVITIPTSKNFFQPQQVENLSVNINNGHLIFQVVPPKSNVIQDLKLTFEDENEKNPKCTKPLISEDECSCSNIESLSRCCETDKEGRVVSLCKQANDSINCRCLPYEDGDLVK